MSTNTPSSFVLAGYSNLVGPSNTIASVLKEADSRGIQTHQIPHNAEDPVKHLHDAVGTDIHALLVSYSHPLPDQTYSPKEAALIGSMSPSAVVASLADLPEHEKLGRGNPFVEETDLVLTAGTYYLDQVPDWGYRNAEVVYPGPPAYLEASLASMRQGQQDRTDGTLLTDAGAVLTPDQILLYLEGDKDLEHILNVAIEMRAAVDKLDPKLRDAIGFLYRPHPGADDFHKRLGTPPEAVQRFRDLIEDRLESQRVLLHPETVAKQANGNAYHFGVANIAFTTRGAMTSWTAALLQKPTISVEQKGDIPDWFVARMAGTAVTNYAELPNTLEWFLSRGGSAMVRAKQAQNFPQPTEDPKNTNGNIVDAILRAIEKKRGS